MSRVQNKKPKKIDGELIQARKSKYNVSYGYPVFCFRYITSNNKHGLKGFAGLHKNGDILLGLIEKIKDWPKYSWTQLGSKSKETGFETIPYRQFEIPLMIEREELTKDTKVHIFRFGGSNYRLIGYKSDIEPNANILHILAFDFDFSAYKH